MAMKLMHIIGDTKIIKLPLKITPFFQFVVQLTGKMQSVILELFMKRQKQSQDIFI